jgi:hypothetical protein
MLIRIRQTRGIRKVAIGGTKRFGVRIHHAGKRLEAAAAIARQCLRRVVAARDQHRGEQIGTTAVVAWREIEAYLHARLVARLDLDHRIECSGRVDDECGQQFLSARDRAALIGVLFVQGLGRRCVNNDDTVGFDDRSLVPEHE